MAETMIIADEQSGPIHVFPATTTEVNYMFRFDCRPVTKRASSDSFPGIAADVASLLKKWGSNEFKKGAGRR